MSLISVTKIWSLILVFVAEQASLSLTWLETPEDMFSHGATHFLSVHIVSVQFEFCLGALYWKPFLFSVENAIRF